MEIIGAALEKGFECTVPTYTNLPKKRFSKQPIVFRHVLFHKTFPSQGTILITYTSHSLSFPVISFCNHKQPTGITT